VTLVGSGTTTVTTPPFFRGLTAVDVVRPGSRQVLAPDGDGRLHFSVDLGPAHPDQEDTVASRAAGDGTPGYFTSAAVRFVPERR
jgi:hypothetical protein